MKDGPNIINIAALIGEQARSEVLTALMSGMAMTATELAHKANVTKQTISAHLAKLVDAGLLAVEAPRWCSGRCNAAAIPGTWLGKAVGTSRVVAFGVDGEKALRDWVSGQN